MSEALGGRHRTERKFDAARGFYGVIGVSMLCELGLQYIQISPMRALYWSAVVNGVVAVPLTAIVVLLASKPKVMGSFVSGRGSRATGWLTTAIMAAAASGMALPG